MSNLSNRPTPNWVWCSLIPLFGSLSLIYAGHKAQISKWMYVGAGLFVAGSILNSSGLAFFLTWAAQILFALLWKEPYLQKIEQRHSGTFDTLKPTGLLTSKRGKLKKLDINTCSKNDLVYQLGLPIVYANNIDLIREDGFNFTHVEELSEIAGLPESYVETLRSHVTFSYDLRREFDGSWKRMNLLDAADLISLGVSAPVAEKIVAERLLNGNYRSVLDIRQRTGISVRSYECLI